jgi:hypothetical protein
MENQEYDEVISEFVGMDSELEPQVEPIETGKGLIAYRKYLWAIKFMEDKVIKLKTYRQQITEDVDKVIESKESTIQHIKEEVKKAMLIDPAVDRTPEGGKTLSLPDIATVSVSKLQTKIDIIDPDAVLSILGKEFIKEVKPSLDITKAKKHIEETGNIPVGAKEREDRILTIRFKK